jgi:hypothetical protein
VAQIKLLKEEIEDQTIDREEYDDKITDLQTRVKKLNLKVSEEAISN